MAVETAVFCANSPHKYQIMQPLVAIDLAEC